MAIGVLISPTTHSGNDGKGEHERYPLFDPNGFESKTILKNSGRYSGIYSTNVDRCGSVKISGQS
jgi:hypothetical protein